MAATEVSGEAGGERPVVGFPGQGGHWAAALRVLDESADHPLARHVTSRLADVALDRGAHTDTRVSQPIVVATGLIAAEALGPLASSSVLAVGGHSLGELTATAAAGAVDPLAAVDLAWIRAELGHRQHRQRPGAMVAVMRTPFAEVETCRGAALDATGGDLVVGVVNSPGQVVLSGDERTVAVAVELLEAAGAVLLPLPIGGAYHSPLLGPMQEEFACAVREAVVADPVCPVICSTAERPLATAEEIRTHLPQGLTRQADWPRALGLALALGATVGLDAGPGDTLVRLARHLPLLAFRRLGSDPGDGRGRPTPGGTG